MGTSKKNDELFARAEETGEAGGDKDRQIEALRTIAALEKSLWSVLFGEPRSAVYLAAELIEMISADPDRRGAGKVRNCVAAVVRSSRNASKRGRGTPGFERAVSALAQELSRLDRDRIYIHALRNALLLAGPKKGKIPATSSHLRRVESACREVDLARHRFIQANQGLVYLVAQRYRNARSQLQFLDLVQEGNIGLIKGLNRFDPDQGVRFATYASWWVQSTISRAVMKKGSTIRVPASAIRRHNALRNAEAALRKKNGVAPSRSDIAEETGIAYHKVERVKATFSTTFHSLDDRVSASGDVRYSDLVADEEAVDPFDAALRNSWSKQVGEHLKVLSDQEREIIALRFGLDDDEEMTLERIGEKYGLCRERIRQIQEKALEKLRARLAFQAA